MVEATIRIMSWPGEVMRGKARHHEVWPGRAPLGAAWQGVGSQAFYTFWRRGAWRCTAR